jgi:hypothetical protein
VTVQQICPGLQHSAPQQAVPALQVPVIVQGQLVAHVPFAQ